MDRTSTFQAFAQSFAAHYFSHLDTHKDLINLIIERDEDGYKNKPELFHELLELLPWLAKPEHKDLMDFYKAEYVKNAILMDRAMDVILHIRSKYKTALITNGRNDIQYRKMDRLGLREHFDYIIVSEEAGCKKPDRRIFELALQHLELEPAQCIFVGDHPVNDIEGAARAGLGTVWMKVNQPWRDELSAQPLHTIERFSDLLELF